MVGSVCLAVMGSRFPAVVGTGLQWVHPIPATSLPQAIPSHAASSPQASRCIIYTVKIDQKMITASLASEHHVGLSA